MIEVILAQCMVGALFLMLFLGYPVAFSLGGVAVVFGGISWLFGIDVFVVLQEMPNRVFGVMKNQILLAVPFFILMGTILERTGLAEELLTAIGELFGKVRGGLAIAVVFVGALLAAATGVVGASVVAMGVISLPVMLERGYNQRLATGVITASGTLGQIIPPSIVLVVLADQMDRVNVGPLFSAALIPGLLLALGYAIYVVVLAFFCPSKAPALEPKKGKGLASLSLVLLPPLLLILLVLGSIFAGLATPSEAGALGAVGAALLALAKRRLSLASIREAAMETARTSTMILFLLIGAQAFTLVLTVGLGGDEFIRYLLEDVGGGATGLIITTAVVIFLLGFFIDFFEIVFIVVPLLYPIAKDMGIDLYWYAVFIAMVLQTSFLTPPFGFSLFYLRSVTPDSVPTSAIYRGAVPFLLIQLLVVVLLAVYPGITSWLMVD